MIGFSLGLGFLSSGGDPVTGGSITVPDEPPVEDPVDTGGGDTGGGDTGGGDTGGGTDPDPTAPTLPLVATARWHPAYSTVTLDTDRVATASDLIGTADLTALTDAGPKAMTDGLGRPFWRFEGDGYLTVPDTLAFSSRDMSVFFVGRFHRVATRAAVFSIGSQAAGTASNTLGPAIETHIQSQSPPLLRSFAKPPNTVYPTPEKMVTGSQMQVVGVVNRADADGGTSLFINDAQITASQAFNRVDIPGAEIGRYAYSPGNSGSWGVFDLYEMVICDHQISDTDAATLITSLMGDYSIVPVTNQLVLEGDSIMQGTGDVIPAQSAGMILTDPGNPQIGADWRVVNMATSGATISNLQARRDTTLPWVDLQLPGQNVLAFELGRNDMAPGGGETPASHYANVVTYLTEDFGTANTSILARGWDLRVMANIASSPSYEADIVAYRALLRDPAFANDLDTDASGAYAGQMQIVETDLITVSGDAVFAASADAADTTYYAGDSTHPNIAGAVARATGGDNPLHGIAGGL